MGDTGKSRNYFAMDECENALDYLRYGEQFITKAASDSRAWKWVSISLYGALYGFAITACPQRFTWKKPGSPRMTLEEFIADRSKDNIIFAPEGSRLISIDWAISIALKQPGRPSSPATRQLPEQLERSVNQFLHVYRDNFVHFHSQRWIIPGNELPNVAADVLDVIELIAVQVGLIDHEVKDEVKQIVERCKSLLTKLR
jgi:hypothetical protein